MENEIKAKTWYALTDSSYEAKAWRERERWAIEEAYLAAESDLQAAREMGDAEAVEEAERRLGVAFGDWSQMQFNEASS